MRCGPHIITIIIDLEFLQVSTIMNNIIKIILLFIGFGSIHAQRSIELEGGLGLPGGDLENLYNNQPYYVYYSNK